MRARIVKQRDFIKSGDIMGMTVTMKLRGVLTAAVICIAIIITQQNNTVRCWLYNGPICIVASFCLQLTIGMLYSALGVTFVCYLGFSKLLFSKTRCQMELVLFAFYFAQFCLHSFFSHPAISRQPPKFLCTRQLQK